MDKEILEKKMQVSRILFKYNVPINEAKIIGTFIEELEQQCKKQQEVIDRLNFIKNRKNQGASQENINKMAIEFVNSYLKEVSE